MCILQAGAAKRIELLKMVAGVSGLAYPTKLKAAISASHVIAARNLFHHHFAFRARRSVFWQLFQLLLEDLITSFFWMPNSVAVNAKVCSAFTVSRFIFRLSLNKNFLLTVDSWAKSILFVGCNLFPSIKHLEPFIQRLYDKSLKNWVERRLARGTGNISGSVIYLCFKVLSKTSETYFVQKFLMLKCICFVYIFEAYLAAKRLSVYYLSKLFGIHYFMFVEGLLTDNAAIHIFRIKVMGLS